MMPAVDSVEALKDLRGVHLEIRHGVPDTGADDAGMIDPARFCDHCIAVAARRRGKQLYDASEAISHGQIGQPHPMRCNNDLSIAKHTDLLGYREPAQFDRLDPAALQHSCNLLLIHASPLLAIGTRDVNPPAGCSVS